MLGVPSSFEEFSLADNEVETSEQVSDGDIVANVLSELEPEPEDDDDDEEDDNEESDADNIGTSSQLLNILSCQKAFMQWNKFPTEVLQQLHALEQAVICQQVKKCKKLASLMSFFN